MNTQNQESAQNSNKIVIVAEAWRVTNKDGQAIWKAASYPGVRNSAAGLCDTKYTGPTPPSCLPHELTPCTGTCVLKSETDGPATTYWCECQ